MRICIPTGDDDGESSVLVDHFGRAPYYTIVDTETDAVEVVANESRHRGGENLPPAFVADHDVDAVIAGTIGRHGVELFGDLGIDVYRGEDGTVAELVDRLASGGLDTIAPEDAHEHGHEHSHEHGHGNEHHH